MFEKLEIANLLDKTVASFRETNLLESNGGIEFEVKALVNNSICATTNDGGELDSSFLCMYCGRKGMAAGTATAIKTAI
jgi:hypothetical protein